MNFQVDEYIELIHACLSKDLLKKGFNSPETSHITTGHCYISSEVIYHTFGGKENWSSYAGKDENGITHWWLKNKHTGEIVDPTKEQYLSLGIEPPYLKGKPCGFLTREPSKRATILLQRISQLTAENKSSKQNSLNKKLFS